MRSICLPLMTGMLLTGCAASQGGSPTTKAASRDVVSASLLDAAGVAKGTATVVSMGDGIHVTVALNGLAPGTYAAHVHTVGSCVAPAFTSAGGHWNPEGRQHGRDNPAGAHKGDMDNMVVGADGNGSMNMHISGVSLDGQSNSLLDADGTAVVIHSGSDDYHTDPTGSAGSRMLCGVLARG